MLKKFLFQGVRVRDVVPLHVINRLPRHDRHADSPARVLVYQIAGRVVAMVIHGIADHQHRVPGLGMGKQRQRCMQGVIKPDSVSQRTSALDHVIDLARALLLVGLEAGGELRLGGVDSKSHGLALRRVTRHADDQVHHLTDFVLVAGVVRFQQHQQTVGEIRVRAQDRQRGVPHAGFKILGLQVLDRIMRYPVECRNNHVRGASLTSGNGALQERKKKQ